MAAGAVWFLGSLADSGFLVADSGFLVRRFGPVWWPIRAAPVMVSKADPSAARSV